MSSEFKVSIYFDDSDVTTVSIGNIQHQGKREYQEDSFGFSALDSDTVRKNGFIAAVSDGMGGLSNGDKVSKYTVSSMLEMCGSTNAALPVHIRFTQMLNAINNAVCGQNMGGGATVSAVYCTQNGVFWCSSGDSRIYLWRSGTLCRLTRDFDYMDNLLDRVIDGVIDYDDALNDPQKDNLAAYIGVNETLYPDVNIRPFIPCRGDKLLICSDGVYNALEHEELVHYLALNAGAAAEDIQRMIFEKNYDNQDNFTAVVLEFS